MSGITLWNISSWIMDYPVSWSNFSFIKEKLEVISGLLLPVKSVWEVSMGLSGEVPVSWLLLAGISGETQMLLEHSCCCLRGLTPVRHLSLPPCKGSGTLGGGSTLDICRWMQGWNSHDLWLVQKWNFKYRGGKYQRYWRHWNTKEILRHWSIFIICRRYTCTVYHCTFFQKTA